MRSPRGVYAPTKRSPLKRSAVRPLGLRSLLGPPPVSKLPGFLPCFIFRRGEGSLVQKLGSRGFRWAALACDWGTSPVETAHAG